MKTYKQLTYAQRCQIYALKKTGLSQTAIAQLIDVTQPTISRELKRNTGLKGYRHKQTQRLTGQRRQSAIKSVKMTAAMIRLIEAKLHEKWSPEQISGWLSDQGQPLVMKPFIAIFGTTKRNKADYI